MNSIKIKYTNFLKQRFSINNSTEVRNDKTSYVNFNWCKNLIHSFECIQKIVNRTLSDC